LHLAISLHYVLIKQSDSSCPQTVLRRLFNAKEEHKPASKEMISVGRSKNRTHTRRRPYLH